MLYGHCFIVLILLLFLPFFFKKKLGASPVAQVVGAPCSYRRGQHEWLAEPEWGAGGKRENKKKEEAMEDISINVIRVTTFCRRCYPEGKHFDRHERADKLYT